MQEVLCELGKRIRSERRQKDSLKKALLLSVACIVPKWGRWSAAKRFHDWTRYFLSLSISGFLFLTCYRGLSHEQEKVEGRDG